MLLRTSEKRAEQLCTEAVKFIATAEHVAARLDEEPQLEWSPAVIGLCKAAEAEIVSRILHPLADQTSLEDLSVDKADKDLGRVAAFCADPTKKPPELGVFAHFLQTFIHSQERRGTSRLLHSFARLAAEWTGSQWVLDPTEFHSALTSLTTDFRNRAAHIDELGKVDYNNCRDLLIGTKGFLWRLVLATGRHK